MLVCAICVLSKKYALSVVAELSIRVPETDFVSALAIMLLLTLAPPVRYLERM